VQFDIRHIRRCETRNQLAALCLIGGQFVVVPIEGIEQNLAALVCCEVRIVITIVSEKRLIMDQRITPVKHIVINVVEAILPMMRNHRVAVDG
jgi:hypothetical protein